MPIFIDSSSQVTLNSLHQPCHVVSNRGSLPCRSGARSFDVHTEPRKSPANLPASMLQPITPTTRNTTMRFMILVKASKESEAGILPSAELLTEMGQYNEQLIKAGVMLAGEGLQDSSKGARVRFSGNKRTVIDGPFAETKELIAGFWIFQVKSKEEAIEWVKRAPNPMPGTESEIEIRQIFEAEDFGDLKQQVPEVFEKEKQFRDADAAKRAGSKK
jgi:hypothetical protein